MYARLITRARYQQSRHLFEKQSVYYIVAERCSNPTLTIHFQTSFTSRYIVVYRMALSKQSALHISIYVMNPVIISRDHLHVPVGHELNNYRVSYEGHDATSAHNMNESMTFNIAVIVWVNLIVL